MQRLLLVEDNEKLGDYFSRAIRREFPELEIRHVRRAEDALRLLAEGTVDVLVLDWWLDAVGGALLGKVAKAISSRTQVIVTTGDRDEAVAEEAQLLGALRVLHKPFELAELLTAVDGALARRSPAPAAASGAPSAAEQGFDSHRVLNRLAVVHAGILAFSARAAHEPPLPEDATVELRELADTVREISGMIANLKRRAATGIVPDPNLN